MYFPASIIFLFIILIFVCRLSFGVFINISLVLSILFFIYAVIGVFLFYDIPYSESNSVMITLFYFFPLIWNHKLISQSKYQLNRYCNFRTFLNAIVALFRVLTNDWDLLQAAVMEYKVLFLSYLKYFL